MAKEQCGCGAMVSPQGKTMHERGAPHQAWLAAQGDPGPSTAAANPEADADGLHPDLVSALQQPTPKLVAKTVRHFLSANGSLPGDVTVRAFLEQHGAEITESVVSSK